MAKKTRGEKRTYRNDLARRVARETGVVPSVVSQVLVSSLSQVEAALAAGEAVVFPGFGVFYTTERKAGTTRHPRTGQPIPVPARRIAAFRTGAVLKRAVIVPRKGRRLFGFGR